MSKIQYYFNRVVDLVDSKKENRRKVCELHEQGVSILDERFDALFAEGDSLDKKITYNIKKFFDKLGELDNNRYGNGKELYYRMMHGKDELDFVSEWRPSGNQKKY